MIHLGDITKIDGHKVPIVDCLVGGSPCQDLSVAGLRKGLEGERSGLFMDQIRLAKEMREEDERRGNSGVDIRPRHLVWENVPGAFSSNKGEDFRIVLEEIAKVADKNAVIPRPEKGKWTTSGCIMGDGWSIAWRVLDSQFFGTPDKPLPQRRRRIALVADFGGHSAPEILFVRNSVSGDIEPSEPKRKGASSDATGGFGADDREGTCYGIDHAITTGGNCTAQGSCVYEGVQGTLKASGPHSVCYGIDGYNADITGDKSSTLGVNCGMSSGRNGVLSFEPVICLQGNGIDRADTAGCNGKGWKQDVSYTLNTVDRHSIAYSIENHPADSRVNIDESGKVQTLTSRMGTGGGNVPMVMELSKCDVIALDRAAYNQGKNAQFDFEVSDKGINSPLVAKGPSAVCYESEIVIFDDQGGSVMSVCKGDISPTLRAQMHGHPPTVTYDKDTSNTPHYIVRRLTPLECERLQGFPDGFTDIGEWTDSKGKVHKASDSARYKALGNSIALPPWKWVLKRLCACYERDATMASLFDGIGGFPYIWEQLNGKGSCLWASEIEEFPMAVTKERFK